MPMHALLVNARTIDFIEQVNGGLRPAPETMECTTYFIHPDRPDDAEPNQLMKEDEFKRTYEFHNCSDNNCNIVERI